MADKETYYEFSYLLSPLTDASNIQKIETTLREIIEKTGGVVESADAPMKRRIAYEIAKFREAFFGAIRFTTHSEQVAEISEAMDGQKMIIRYMIVHWQRPQLRTMRRTAGATYTPKKEDTPIVDAAAIDRQLDEIFKEE